MFSFFNFSSLFLVSSKSFVNFKLFSFRILFSLVYLSKSIFVVFKSLVKFSIFLKLSTRSWSHIAHFLKFSFSFTWSLYFCSHFILSSTNNLSCLSWSSIFVFFSLINFSLSFKVFLYFLISSNLVLFSFCKFPKSSLFIFIILVNSSISFTAFSCLFINIICCLFNSIISESFSFISSKNLLLSEKINFTFINFSSISLFLFFNFVFSSNNSCILFWKFITTSLDIFSIILFKFLFSLNKLSIFSWYNFWSFLKSGFLKSIFNLFNSLSNTFLLSAKIQNCFSFWNIDKSLLLYFPLYMAQYCNCFS